MSPASKSLQKLQSPLGKGGRWWGAGGERGTHVDGYCAPFRKSTEDSAFMLWVEWQMGLEEARYSPESRVWQAKAPEFPLYLGGATPWNRSEGQGLGAGGRGGIHKGVTRAGTPDAWPPAAPLRSRSQGISGQFTWARRGQRCVQQPSSQVSGPPRWGALAALHFWLCMCGGFITSQASWSAGRQDV